MKKITFKTILMFVIYVLLICNICYADVVYTPTVMEDAVNILKGEGDLGEIFLIFVPIIIVYSLLVEILLLRNKKKTKVKKIIVVLITVILLVFEVILINNNVQNEIKDKIKNEIIETVKYGYVDKDNNFVIEPKDFDYAEEFSYNVAKIGYFERYYPGFGHGNFTRLKYGYINRNGKIIIPAEYDDLSYFNEDGYAYGIITFMGIPISFYNIDQFYEETMNTHFYKIDMNGNKEEISYEEILKEDILLKKNDSDPNIKLVKQDDKQYEKSADEHKEDIYECIIITICYMTPIIVHIIIAIIVLIKAFKKTKKEDVEIDEKNE